MKSTQNLDALFNPFKGLNTLLDGIIKERKADRKILRRLCDELKKSREQREQQLKMKES